MDVGFKLFLLSFSSEPPSKSSLLSESDGFSISVISLKGVNFLLIKEGKKTSLCFSGEGIGELTNCSTCKY